MFKSCMGIPNLTDVLSKKKRKWKTSLISVTVHFYLSTNAIHNYYILDGRISEYKWSCMQRL